MKNQILKKNIMTAYLISVPSGLLMVFITFALPVIITGEGLAGILLVETYGWAITGLILSFLISIWFGSKKAHSHLIKNKSLLNSSFCFSLTVNTIIWSIFLLLTIIKNFDYNILFVLILPVFGFIISLVGTTFTIGLLITYIFAKNLRDSNHLN